MNRTKKEIYEDYKMLKIENEKLKEYLRFWLGPDLYNSCDIKNIDDIFKKTKKRTIIFRNISILLSIILLCGAFYLFGLIH